MTLAAIAARAAPSPGETLVDACGRDPGIICRTVWSLVRRADMARFFDVYLAGPVMVLLRVAAIVVVALVVRAVAHRLVNRVIPRVAEGAMPERVRRRTRTIFDGSPALLSERRRQRLQTMGSVLRSAASVLVFGTATLMILAELGVNLAPLLASASIVGVAIAFGAQNLVKDFLSGIFMLLEDQYGVGDIIDVGQASGTVEAVTLRITRLRDINGVVWYVRNGEIVRVGNESQNWARAVIDVPVPLDADTDRVSELIKQAADQMWHDPLYEEIILEEPQVWGVESVSSSGVVLRLAVKTAPSRQYDVARELRERIKNMLLQEGIPFAGGG